jgi:glycosyltransferase involved in cell wall biosynthesis
MDRSRVAIVIPAFNESLTIIEVVNNASLYGVPIVVNDGSTDNTGKLAEQAGAIVVVHKTNLGYDAALNSGFVKANDIGSAIFITLDGDGQHNPELIMKFIELIDSGCDYVIGIRHKKQRIGEHIFAWYTKQKYGIRDPLCGMKAYKKSAYMALGYFDSYGSIGTQLSLFLAKRRYSLGQIAFQTNEREDQPRFGRGIKANYKIIRAMVLSFFLK